MDLFSDPLTWRDSEVTFAARMPRYPLIVADPHKLSAQDPELIVLGGGDLSSIYEISPPFECGLKDCDRLSMNTVKSGSLTIYNIESDETRLRDVGRTSSCISTNSFCFNLQQHEDVNHCGLFHDYQVPSQMIDAREDVSTLVSSPGGSSQVLASGFQILDQVDDSHQPCGAFRYGHPFDGSYAIKFGSDFSSMDVLLSGVNADGSSAKTAIKTHPLYPYLVSAHINCCEVGAKAADVKSLEEAHSRHQHLQSRNNSRSSSVTKPELDSIMAWYLGMLLDLKAKVEEPFFTEMEWCNEVFDELKLLGPSKSPVEITVWGTGEGQSNTDWKEGSAFNVGESSTYASPSDQKNGITTEQVKQAKVVKEWLRSKHDRSEIYNLRGQCKRKRRQGKHPDTARERLVEWFNDHADWPYPSEEEKQKLAEQTNLEARQINNWFINQRKRHWDSPSKEETIHQALQDLESQRQISSLEKFVMDRFYVPVDMFNPSHSTSYSWSTSLT